MIQSPIPALVDRVLLRMTATEVSTWLRPAAGQATGKQLQAR